MEQLKLKAIYSDLLHGTSYCGVDRYGRGIGRIYFNNGYIHYSYYGSSAIELGIDHVKWLLETIFNDCIDFVPCHWSDYHVNYIPCDPRYKGIDASRQHPNVYGL